jgi:hypothetical protein
VDASLAVVAVVAAARGVGVPVAVDVGTPGTVAVGSVRISITVIVLTVIAVLCARQDLALARAPGAGHAALCPGSTYTDPLGSVRAAVARPALARGAIRTVVVEAAVAVLVDVIAADLLGGRARHGVAFDPGPVRAADHHSICLTRSDPRVAAGPERRPVLVGLAVAVVVLAVAQLGGPGIHSRVGIVTVELGMGAIR